MYEWLEGLQKSAKRTAEGVGTEDVRRAETECGVPFPEELATLFQRFDGGEFQGDVTLFKLHGPEGSLSVMDKTRLKLEGLPAAGVWRIGVKGPHRQLFAARKSAMQEQSDEPLPGWAEAFSGDDWLYGTWETEQRELRLYRSLGAMLDVLVPPAEVEEFGDRTFANALSAVQGALSDLSVEYDEGEGAQPKPQNAQAEMADEAGADAAPEEADEAQADAEEDEAAQAGEVEEDEAGMDGDAPHEAETAEAEGGEDDEELRRPVVAAARRRMGKLRSPPDAEDAAEDATPKATPRRAVKKAPARKAPAKKAATKKAATKKAATKKAAAKKAPATKGAAKKASARKAAATKTPAKKAAAKKAPARKAAAKKTPAKKTPAKKAPARKATAKKGASRQAASKRGAARGRR